MQCKFCREERKLIEAHVIPRSFFEIDPKQSPKVASSKEGVYSKRAPAGLYDRELVCEACERLFSPFDDYAQELLLKNRDEAREIVDNGQAIVSIYNRYDYAKLKLFFLSLLWRGSESSHYFFHRIDLGPHRPVIQQAVIDSNPGGPGFYSVLLAKFPKPLGILDPHMTRFDNVKFCQLYLAEYIVYIKVDKQKLPEAFRGMELADGRPLLVLGRDPASSRDTQVMREIALKDLGFLKRK